MTIAEPPKEPIEMIDKYEKIDEPHTFVTNKAEIPKLRAARKYKIVTERLLGSFDDNGKYVISPHIMAELLAMPKLLDSEDENGKMFLSAEYKDGTIFKLIATEPRKKKNSTDNNIFSSLEFCETIKFAGGYQTETVSTVIGSYKTINVLKFNEGRRNAFNIFDRDDPAAKTRTPTDCIDAKLTYLALIEERKNKSFEKIEKKFFKSTLKALKKVPNGKKLLTQFLNKKDVVDNFVDKKDPSRYRAYNDMLTLLTEDPENMQVVQSVEYQKHLGKINKAYLDDMKSVNAEIDADPKLQDIKKARAILNALPVDEYYASLTSNQEKPFSIDTIKAGEERLQASTLNGPIFDANKPSSKPRKDRKKRNLELGGNNDNEDILSEIVDIKKFISDTYSDVSEKQYETNRQISKNAANIEDLVERQNQEELDKRDLNALYTNSTSLTNNGGNFTLEKGYTPTGESSSTETEEQRNIYVSNGESTKETSTKKGRSDLKKGGVGATDDALGENQSFLSYIIQLTNNGANATPEKLQQANHRYKLLKNMVEGRRYQPTEKEKVA